MASSTNNPSQYQFPAPRPRKSRIRTIREAGSPSSSTFNLDDFDDNLLTEILHRLPTAKSTFRCKLVSKRWHYLISSPCFISRFVTHHANAFGDHQDESSTLLLSYFDRRHKIVIRNLPGSPLKPLEKEGPVSIVASFNDLLLCSANKMDFMAFYIVNPLTRQWVALPSMPNESSRYTAHFGFICEPYCAGVAHGEDAVNERYRCGVVCIIQDYAADWFTVRTYCSENNEWSEIVLPRDEEKYLTNIVAYNGKLHWYNGKNIVTYDPYDDAKLSSIDCSKIPTLTGNALFFYGSCLGVCRGRLRMLQWPLRQSGLYFFTVWQLNDYETKREWSRTHQVRFDAMTSSNPSLQMYIKEFFCCILRVVAMDQSNTDIVYLEIEGIIVSCDLRKQKLEVVDRCLDKHPLAGWGFKYVTQKENFYGGSALQLVFPWWPTPIPNFSYNDKASPHLSKKQLNMSFIHELGLKLRII